MRVKLSTKQLCKHFIDFFYLLLLRDVEQSILSTKCYSKAL